MRVNKPSRLRRFYVGACRPTAREMRAKPWTRRSSRVVHAALRARLDPAHAQRIIAITDAGDRGLIALQACQAYVRTISH